MNITTAVIIIAKAIELGENFNPWVLAFIIIGLMGAGAAMAH